MNLGNRVGRIRLQSRDLPLEDGAAAVILVAEVNIDGVDTDSPGCNQRAFDKAMRIALEIIAVLKGPGFAFIDVDRHQARRGLH
jgi:hypothetical protein